MEQTSEKEYPLFFQRLSRSAWFTVLVTGVSMLLALLINALYTHFSNDLSPDSPGGYTYAIVGTSFMLLAALRYSLYRRSHKRGVGQLNGTLNWHMFFGVLGLFILFLHAFGNFNPRTGTYALYGMIALVISGIVGKAFDRIMPRLIANEVRKAITAQGDDRIESISQQLQDIMDHNSQKIGSFPSRDNSIVGVPFMFSPAGKTTTKKDQSPVMQSSWDLAYFSLDETPQELNQQAAQYRFVPDRKSDLARPGTYLPGTEEQLAALQMVQHALQLEQCYRYIIRYWRIFHIFLALLTIGLTIWHIVYAAQLLGNAFLH
jgi:hypothetical protein